jgi:phage repressor protein C with HTH and peptisase S24 domain
VLPHGRHNRDIRDKLSSVIREYRDGKIRAFRKDAGMDDQHSFKVWLAKKLDESPRGTRARLAKHLGLTPTKITRMAAIGLGAETRDIKAHELPKIEEFFGQKADGSPHSDSDVVQPVTGGFAHALVAGVVEAGSFIEIDEFDQREPERVIVPEDPEFPRARILVFEIRGDSMNAMHPPLLPGGRAICVAYEDVAHLYPVRDGMTVVVERTRDGGHLREWSVKQVELHDDRVEFHPRSTNPKHRPIIVDRDAQADDGTRIEIIALVRSVTNKIS